MSHETVWRCDRCTRETRVLAEVIEVEVRRQEVAGARIAKAQHDLCRDCALDLDLFMDGTRLHESPPA